MEGPEPSVREPRRVVVASYDSYAEAQRAVDYLSDEMFPVERVAIVAEDLRLVEQVTGRMGYGRAALQGVGFGALIGIIIGFFVGGLSSYIAFLWLIYGALIGLIVALVNHALSGGQRDFSSIEGIQAGRYNVMIDEELAAEGSRLLAGLGGSPEDVGKGTTPKGLSTAGEEAGPLEKEEARPKNRRTPEVPPREEPATRETPLSEERPERRRATPSTEDASREVPPSGEEQPRRPGEERPPSAGEEPPRRPR